MAGPRNSLQQLSRQQLAVLVPELLLAGHLIDRSGLPHVLLAFGPDAKGNTGGLKVGADLLARMDAEGVRDLAELIGSGS